MLESGYSVCQNGTIALQPFTESNWPCVYISRYQLKFVDAEAECKSEGGHLMSILNAYINSVIIGGDLDL